MSGPPRPIALRAAALLAEMVERGWIESDAVQLDRDRLVRDALETPHVEREQTVEHAQQLLAEMGGLADVEKEREVVHTLLTSIHDDFWPDVSVG